MNLETEQAKRIPAQVADVPVTAALPGNRPAVAPPRFKGMIAFTVILVLCFALPLYWLVGFAVHTELYSHILLIPFVSGYLIWINRGEVVKEFRPNPLLALLSAGAGVLALGGYWLSARDGWAPPMPDYLAVMVFSFLCLLFAGAFMLLGSKLLRSIAFPAAFLFFCIPFPVAVRHAIESFFQHGSAETAYGMLRMAGMSVLQTDTKFQMPGFSLEVAPQCSGIHSNVVLVITSLIAAYLFMKSPAKRLLFVVSVIPLALLRNGFRIFTISELCVHVGPQMIDSWIHHHGGPIFFMLSLVPLFLLLIYLSKSEARKEQAATVDSK